MGSGADCVPSERAPAFPAIPKQNTLGVTQMKTVLYRAAATIVASVVLALLVGFAHSQAASASLALQDAQAAPASPMSVPF